MPKNGHQAIVVWPLSRGGSSSLPTPTTYYGDVTGKKPGTVTITHTYNTGNGWGSKKQTETFTVHVVAVKGELEIKAELVNSGSGVNGAFKVGDTVQIKLTVTNKGNVEIEDIKATDSLTNFETTVGTIDELEDKNDSETITVTHIVTEADVTAGTITYIARTRATKQSRPSRSP